MRSIDSNYNPIWRIEFGSRLSPIGRIELRTYMNVCHVTVQLIGLTSVGLPPPPRKLGMVLFCFNLV